MKKADEQLTGAAGSAAAVPAAAPAPAKKGLWRRVLDAVDERLGIGALAYPVPEHANGLAWSLGGITAVAFAILVVTGIILVQFYSPAPETANQSVRGIVTDVWGGSFLRGLHFWAAQAMYVTAVLHVARVFVTGSFKKPREGNWLIGVAMFGLVTLAVFTGTVLKWDQEGYEALMHNIEVGTLLGGVGIWFSPSFADQIPILFRLYAAHAVIVPGLILTLVVLHFLLVKRHRISPHPSLRADPSGEQAAQDEPTEPFTHHLRRIAAFGLVLSGLLGVLAVAFPQPIGPSPVQGIEVTAPPWMFWWPFALENWFGVPAILWGETAFFVILAAVPFLDRSKERSWRRRPLSMSLAAALVLALAVLSVLMVVLPRGEHL